MTNHVLHQHPLPRQLPVGAALLLAQRFAFRLLERCLRVFVYLLQALITGIAKYANVFGNLKSGLFEHREIVRFPISLSSANDPTSRLVNDNLRFYRVPLFLARIISALFFFGRSIGVSVTSTMTNSKVFSLSRNTFLPGSFKWLQFLSRFSILTMVRETVASDSCQRLARWNWVGY